MNKSIVLVLVIAGLLSVGSVVVAAEGPEDVDQCSIAPELEPDQYSSEVGPDNSEVFTVPSAQEGDYITFEVDPSDLSGGTSLSSREYEGTLIIRAAGAYDHADFDTPPYIEYQESEFAGEDDITRPSADHDEMVNEPLWHGIGFATNWHYGQDWTRGWFVLDSDQTPCFQVLTYEDSHGKYDLTIRVHSEDPTNFDPNAPSGEEWNTPDESGEEDSSADDDATGFQASTLVFMLSALIFIFYSRNNQDK